VTARTIRPARTVAGRRRQIARLRDEALTPPRPQPDVATPGTTSKGRAAAEAPDVAALVRAEVEQQRHRDRRAAEAAEVESFRCPVGRGCWRCGLGYCNTRRWRSADVGGAQGVIGDPELVPGWTITPQGAECLFCTSDPAIAPRAGDTADDVRVRVIAALLDLPGVPMRALGDPGAFASCRLWFIEHPDAEPAVDVDDRWRHVNLDTLRRSWDAIAEGRDEAVPDPPIMTDDPCPSCGCTERFVIRHAEMPREGTGRDGRLTTEDWDNTHFVPIAGDCVDCSIAWRAQASGYVPSWWIERRGRELPGWAKQFTDTERVPA
jgi:hypothetical protein